MGPSSVRGNLSRREFLGAVAVSALATACQGTVPASTPVPAATSTAVAAATPTASAATSYGKLTHQLSWVKNIQFAGCFMADAKGYYKAEGFTEAEILPGGPNVAPVPIVTSGKALTGFVSFPGAASARAQGAKIKIIGAKYQRNPSGITSLKKGPIKTPADLIGKRIGVGAASLPTWNAFLAANGIDRSKVTTVSVQFDPQPLVNGEVDGWYSFIISQPNVLKSRGVEVEVMAFHDFNYATAAEGYFVTEETAAKSREQLKAFLAGEVQGWRSVLTNPEEAARLTVDKYGKDLGLDYAEQLLELKDQNRLVLTAESRAYGLLSLTPEQQEQAARILKLTGTSVDAVDLFDLSLLNELYSERPKLKAGL